MFAFSPAIDLPEIDFHLTEVELVDPDTLQGLVGDPEPEPLPPEPLSPAPPTPEQIEEAKRQAEAEAEKKAQEEAKKAEAAKKRAEAAKRKRETQRKNFANRGTNADQLSPPRSTFHLLLVPKKIRKLPFADTAFKLLEPWPDFDFLVRKGGLDPLNDFDHIVIASPNITDARETFLAVDFKTSRGKIKKAIERAVAREGLVIEWVDDGGFLRGNPRPKNPQRKDLDPRWFVFHPKKKVAMFVRDAFLDQILADSDAPAGEEGTARAFVDNLTKLRKFAAEQPLAGMQLKVADLSNAVSGVVLPVPLPDTLELSVEASTTPITVLKLTFLDVVAAKKFLNFYDEELKAYIVGLAGGGWLGEGAYSAVAKPILDKIAISREDETVTLRAEFSRTHIETLLNKVAELTSKTGKAADAKRARGTAP